MVLEICAGSLTSALNASKGGAHRIELCDNLSEGGTTPSPGTIRQAVRLLDIPVFVLVRPRPGDFLYTPEEFESMKEDVLFCREHGADGVVLGVLKADGSVDTDRFSELIRLARPMQVTFHRAFDMTNDPFAALEDIISLGCDRILTSGQAASVTEGLDLLSSLIKKAGNRIKILPGGGINEDNALEVIRKTGAGEVHASLRSPFNSDMKFRNEKANLGKPGIGEYTRLETDPARVRMLLTNLESSFH